MEKKQPEGYEKAKKIGTRDTNWNLRKKRGERDRNPDGSLAPRDVVTEKLKQRIVDALEDRNPDESI